MHYMTWSFGGVPYDNLDRYYYRFSSFHPGSIVNYALTDGSVRSVNLSVDRQVLLQLAGKGDGQQLKAEQLMTD